MDVEDAVMQISSGLDAFLVKIPYRTMLFRFAEQAINGLPKNYRFYFFLFENVFP